MEFVFPIMMGLRDCLDMSNGGGRTKKEKRRAAFRRQGGMCAICGKPMSMKTASLDHIVPLVYGGGVNTRNLRATHKSCNGKRGSDMANVFIEIEGIVAMRDGIIT